VDVRQRAATALARIGACAVDGNLTVDVLAALRVTNRRVRLAAGITDNDRRKVDVGAGVVRRCSCGVGQRRGFEARPAARGRDQTEEKPERDALGTTGTRSSRFHGVGLSLLIGRAAPGVASRRLPHSVGADQPQRPAGASTIAPAMLYRGRSDRGVVTTGGRRSDGGHDDGGGGTLDSPFEGRATPGSRRAGAKTATPRVHVLGVQSTLGGEHTHLLTTSLPTKGNRPFSD
jgi:hypothetical protein